MDFHQLRIFIEVVRQKNFSRAAEKIFLTQPTVSIHIKALENEIGVPLLDRSQRELQLTGAGEILYQYAQQLLNLEKKATFAIQQEYRIIKGHLEIAASSIPGAYILPRLMKEFSVMHPEVTFAVMHRDTQRILESVKDYTYDLGFVGESVRPSGLKQVKLLRDELVLAAAPGTSLLGERPPREGKKESEDAKSDPVAPSPLYEIDLKTGANLEALLKTPFIMREPGSATRVVFENALKKFCGKREVKLNVVAYLESQEAIREAVKIGLGITAISHKAVREELAAGLMKGYRLPDLQLERNLYLIHRHNCVFSPLSQAFLDHCFNTYKIDKEKPDPPDLL